MTFLESFLCGTGISLGICVGLVAWVCLREFLEKTLGREAFREEQKRYSEDTLAALQTRNDMTAATTAALSQSATAIEEMAANRRNQ